MFCIRTNIGINAFLLLVFALSSCSNFFIPYFEVLGYSYDNKKIEIEFSSDIDSEKTKKAFFLTEEGVAVSGTFNTHGKTLSFFPMNGIKENCKYELTLSTIAEDCDGKSLKEKFYTTFTTKTESISPLILKIVPEEIISDSFQYMEIIFSEPVQEESFYSAFKIEPSFPYIIDFVEDGSKVHIIPTQKISKGVIYTVSINEELKDKNNNNLKEKYLHRIQYAADRNPPEFKLYYQDSMNNKVLLQENPYENHKVPKNAKILINFNEEINMDYIGSKIEIYPSTVKYSYEVDHSTYDMVSILLNGNYGDSITITIDKGIEDLYGNKIEEDKCYRIILDDERFRPVSFYKGFIQIDANNNYKEISYDTQYSNLGLDPLYFGNDKISRNAFLYLIFRTSDKSNGLDYFSVLDAISFKTTNSCCSISIKNAQIISTDNLNEYPLNLIGNNDDFLCCIKFRLEITNTNKNGLIELNIDKNIKDSIGNKMENDISLVFNK